jgi:hypothetical protein
VAQESAGTITWSGDIDLDALVTITFNALANPSGSDLQTIVNTAWIDDGLGRSFPVQAAVIVNAERTYLPVTSR